MRLTAHLYEFLQNDPTVAAHATFWITNFIVTLYDQILFEAHAFAPESIEEIIQDSTRFVLRALGFHETLIQELLEETAP